MGRLLLLPMIFFSLSIQAQEAETLCPTITHSYQEFCDYVYNETAKAVDAATISDLQVDGQGKEVIWYSGEGEILSSGLNLVDGETYFAGFADGTCTEFPSVTVRVDRQPVAGRTSTVYLCSNSGPVEIFDLMPALTDGTGRTAESGGTVKPSLASGGTLFDPRLDKSGVQYAYTTNNSQYGICGPDTASIRIYIVEGADAGEAGEAYFEMIHPAKDLYSFLGGTPDLGGSWSPPLVNGMFDPKVNVPGIYTYTVFGADKVCEEYASSSTVNVTVNYETTTVCHKGVTILVKNNSLNGHLRHGDTFGGCEDSSNTTVVFPNPSRGVYSFSSDNSDIMQVNVLDLNGGVLKNFNNPGKKNSLDIDITEFDEGIYFAEIITTKGKQVERLIKE